MTRYLVAARPHLTPAQVVDLSRVLPDVVDVAPMVRVVVLDTTEATAAEVLGHPDVLAVDADEAASPAVTVDATQAWHLDRIDQPALPLDGAFTYTHDGAGVRVYVLDNGVQPTHVEVAGRTAPGYQAGSYPPYEPVGGHGTTVASAAAGATVGVARAATIVSVNIAVQSNSDSNSSALISALDWIVANHPDGTPGVANLSYDFTGNNTSVDAAAAALQDTAGVALVNCAGNNNTTAVGSPRRAAGVLCIGSSNIEDGRSTFSNYGPLVDLYAPGSQLLLANALGGDEAYSVTSGTSVSSPLVAGVLAAMLHADPTLTPAQLGADLLALAVPYKVTGVPTGTSAMLYTGTTTAGDTGTTDPGAPAMTLPPLPAQGTEATPENPDGWYPHYQAMDAKLRASGLGAGMTRTGTTSPAQTGFAAVPLNAVERQDDGYTCDTVAGTITVAAAGWYVVSGSAFLGALVAGYSQAYVSSAGEYVVRGDQRSATTGSVSCSGAAYLPAGTVLVLNVQTGAATGVQASASTYLRVVRL